MILPATSDSWFSDSLARWGAGGLSYRLTSEDWLHSVSPYHELLRVNIGKLLRQTAQAGALNEHAAPDLAKELLAAAVLSKPELLNEPNRGPGAEHLPLTAGRLRYWLLLQQHWHRLEDELVQSKVFQGKIPAQSDGGVISFSRPALTEDERQELRRRSDALVAKGASIEGPRWIPLDNVADTLKRAIDAVGSDAAVIAGPLFPQAEKYWRRPLWTRQALAELLGDQCRFLSLFLENYQCLIASNFPTLKHHFTLFRHLPVLVRVSALPPHQPHANPTLFAEYFVSDGFALEENMIEAVEYADRVPLATLRAGGPIQIDGRAFKWFMGHGGWPHHLGHPYTASRSGSSRPIHRRAGLHLFVDRERVSRSRSSTRQRLRLARFQDLRPATWNDHASIH